MNFIMELLDAHEYYAIMAVVNYYSKHAHFILTYMMCSMMDAANMY